MEVALERDNTEGKFLARVYSYVAAGLLLTAIIAFALGAIFANAFVSSENPEAAASTFVTLVVISFVALIVDTIVMRVVMSRNNHSGWIPYIIYCALFGVFLSTFVVAGVPFRVFGEAFAISALVFLLLFLIGYFSPINLNVLASVGLALLFGVVLIGLLGLIFLIAFPEVFALYDLLISGVVLVVMIILIAADAYNIKRIGQSGMIDNNIILLCAVNLYTDFIYIFVRVLSFLLRNRNN